MDAMDVGPSDGEEENINQNEENEETPNDEQETEIQITDDSGNSPVPDDMNTTEEVREDIQTKLLIGHKSLAEINKTNSPTNKGDGAIDQRIFKSKDAIPSTSKVVVKRKVREPRVRDICVLRPILPRKSKEKAKQMLKVIAKGLVIPREVVFQQRVRKRNSRTMRRPNMNMIRLTKKRMMSKNSLQTVWMRDRTRRRSRSSDSWCSDIECPRCGCCSNHQFY